MQQILQIQRKTAVKMMKLRHNAHLQRCGQAAGPTADAGRGAEQRDGRLPRFSAQKGCCGNTMQGGAKKSPKDGPRQRAKSGEKKKFL
ncbi:MAG: hypothetical protein LUD78_11070 [Clostridiales bacterium]|nr:hypothetical protein [Clostridiales bacterium]